MNTLTKRAIKSGVIAGITFGIITAGLEYFEGQNFKIWKFIFNVLFFGTVMSLLFNYSMKKQQKDGKNE